MSEIIRSVIVGVVKGVISPLIPDEDPPVITCDSTLVSCDSTVDTCDSGNQLANIDFGDFQFRTLYTDLSQVTLSANQTGSDNLTFADTGFLRRIGSGGGAGDMHYALNFPNNFTGKRHLIGTIGHTNSIILPLAFMVDVNNFIGIRMIGTGVRLQEKIAGAFNTIEDSTGISIGDVLELTIQGADIEVFRNGASIITHTSANFNGETAGLNSGTVMRNDNDTAVLSNIIHIARIV